MLDFIWLVSTDFLFVAENILYNQTYSRGRRWRKLRAKRAAARGGAPTG